MAGPALDRRATMRTWISLSLMSSKPDGCLRPTQKAQRCRFSDFSGFPGPWPVVLTGSIAMGSVAVLSELYAGHGHAGDKRWSLGLGTGRRVYVPVYSLVREALELKGAGAKGCGGAWYRWSQALFQEQRLGQVPGTMMLSLISVGPSCGHCIEPILSQDTHSGSSILTARLPQSLRPSSSAISNPHSRSQQEWSSQPRGGSRERFGSWLLNGKGCDSATRQSGCHWMGGHRT